MYFHMLAGNTVPHQPLKWFCQGFNSLNPVCTLSETITRLSRNLHSEKPEQVCTSRYLHCEKPLLIRILTVVAMCNSVPEPTFWETSTSVYPDGTLWETCFHLHINCCCCVQLCTRAYILRNLNRCLPVGTLWETSFHLHIYCCCCVQLCTGACILRNLNKCVPVGTLWETSFHPHIYCCCCVQLCTGSYILRNLNKCLPTCRYIVRNLFSSAYLLLFLCNVKSPNFVMIFAWINFFLQKF